MLSLAALIFLCLGAALSNVSIFLGLPAIVVGFAFAAAAYHRPGDMEWLLGLFLLAGIGWSLVQFGALLGLWSS